MSEDVGSELWWRREGEVWSGDEGECVRGDQVVPAGDVFSSSFPFYSSSLYLSFSVKIKFIALIAMQPSDSSPCTYNTPCVCKDKPFSSYPQLSVALHQVDVLLHL